jgi:hypothetical protein
VFSLIVLQIHFHLPVVDTNCCGQLASPHPHDISGLNFAVQLISQSEIGYPGKDQRAEEENFLRKPQLFDIDLGPCVTKDMGEKQRMWTVVDRKAY